MSISGMRLSITLIPLPWILFSATGNIGGNNVLLLNRDNMPNIDQVVYACIARLYG
jgi:hypothetical protein